jgi:antitoxin PrlF
LAACALRALARGTPTKIRGCEDDGGAEVRGATWHLGESCYESASCHPVEMARKTSYPVRMGPQGRLVVPVELRRQLGLDKGSRLAIRSDGKRLILEPRSEVLRRLRQRFSGVRDVSLADELEADHEAEALLESRE